MSQSLSPAEEKRLTKDLERKERMLTQDIRIAGALLEMIEAKLLPARCTRHDPLARKDPKGLQAWTGPMAWLAQESVLGYDCAGVVSKVRRSAVRASVQPILVHHIPRHSPSVTTLRNFSHRPP